MDIWGQVFLFLHKIFTNSINQSNLGKEMLWRTRSVPRQDSSSELILMHNTKLQEKIKCGIDADVDFEANRIQNLR